MFEASGGCSKPGYPFESSDLNEYEILSAGKKDLLELVQQLEEKQPALGLSL